MPGAQWDEPDQAYRTVLIAERTAPGEVRTRNAAVRRLVTDLMATPRASRDARPARTGQPGARRRLTHTFL
ncbi:MAG: hypothetical protein ACRDSP_03970 [Pseudonocardiaceae bacterium]